MCDTLCIRLADRMLFAKNSDRPAREPQVVESRARRAADPTGVRMQYVTIPDVDAAAAIVSRPTWLRGAEHGVNEHRVAIGNEKIWTVDDPRGERPALIGMDLVSLVLDRARDADEALAALTDLLTAHGQGGSGEADRDVPYYSSFLLADPERAWIVETSGRRFAARPAARGDSISNRVSIGTDWTVASHDVEPGTDIDTWRLARIPTAIADGRLVATRACATSATTPREIVATLRDHGRPWGAPGSDAADVEPPPTEVRDDFAGITVCMHTGGADTTTASMVCDLPADRGEPVRAWFALGSPCVSVFVPAFPPFVAPELADARQWSRFAELRDRVERDPAELHTVRAELAPVEAELWDAADVCTAASDRAGFAAGAYAPVDAALRRLRV